jgi:FtsP/CotA-like multicopper oxidase with cupredoxin domain
MSTPENPPPTGGDEPGRGLSGVQRAGVVLGGLAVLLIAFVIFRGGDDSGSPSSSSAPQTTSTQTGTSAATGTSSGTSSATSTGEDSQGSSSDDAQTTTGGTATGDGSSSSTASTSTQAQPAVQTVRVVNGQPAGGIKTISVKKGDRVRLKVQSDVADEIHVHGYDLKKDVTAGGSVQFDFKATIEGRFEIELEKAATQIANLEVTPS